MKTLFYALAGLLAVQAVAVAPAQQGKVVQKPALAQSNMNVITASIVANHVVDKTVDSFIKMKDQFDAIGSKI